MKVAVRAGIASVRLGAYSQRRLNDYSTQMSSGFRRYIYIYIYFIIRSKTFRWHTIQIHLKKHLFVPFTPQRLTKPLRFRAET